MVKELALLELLDISECGATEILPDLSWLLKLKQLKLRCYRLRQINEVTRLTSLEILDISGCGAIEMLRDLSS